MSGFGVFRGETIPQLCHNQNELYITPTLDNTESGIAKCSHPMEQFIPENLRKSQGLNQMYRPTEPNSPSN